MKKLSAKAGMGNRGIRVGMMGIRGIRVGMRRILVGMMGSGWECGKSEWECEE